jgi:hypothetical protein
MTTPAFYYSNLAVANTIGAAISNSATAVYCNTAPSGYPTTYPFKLVLGGQEIVVVTAGSGTSGSPWTITRAQDGTSAAAWAAGASLSHQITAGDEALSRTHEIAGSGQLPHGLPGAAWLSGGFSTIGETTLANSTTSSVPFTAIPQTFKNLLIIVQARLTEVTLQSDDITCVVNGDATARYNYVTIWATNISGSGIAAMGSAPGNFTGTASNWPLLRVSASLAGSAVTGGGGFALIPNYNVATFNKAFYSLSGAGSGNAGMADMRIRAGWYNPTTQAAITSLTLGTPAGSNFLLGSFFGLYAFG